jgi:hypothetical protein
MCCILVRVAAEELVDCFLADDARVLESKPASQEAKVDLINFYFL